jgi:hypothetical protein
MHPSVLCHFRFGPVKNKILRRSDTLWHKRVGDLLQIYIVTKNLVFLVQLKVHATDYNAERASAE